MPGFLFTNWDYRTGAQSLQVITLVVPNPEWQAYGSNAQAKQVDGAIAFSYFTSFSIQTLSRTGANSGNDVTGLLYVPDIAQNDPCYAESTPYIPANATRPANLPQTDYDLIALAPWTSPACALKYMEAARDDPVRGFLVFLPGNMTGPPPDKDSPMWSIPGEEKWKTKNGFPVYATNSETANLLLNESAKYSGNMTDVPHGHDLTELYDSRDYVRLYVDIDTGILCYRGARVWLNTDLYRVGCIIAVIMGVFASSTCHITRHHWHNIVINALAAKKETKVLTGTSSKWRGRPGSSGHQTSHCASGFIGQDAALCLWRWCARRARRAIAAGWLVRD